MSSLYNTPCIKHKLVVSIYSNTETSLAMSTLAIWCRVVQSRDVSPHHSDGLVMSGLAFSVAPPCRHLNLNFKLAFFTIISRHAIFPHIIHIDV